MNRLLLAMTFVLPLAACSTAAPPELLNARSPVDSSVGLRDTHHHNPVGKFTSRTPVEPKGWKQLNNDQAPEEKVPESGKKIEGGPETPIGGLDDPVKLYFSSRWAVDRKNLLIDHEHSIPARSV